MEARRERLRKRVSTKYFTILNHSFIKTLIMNPYNKDNKTKAYSSSSYSTLPIRTTRFFRKCVIWQFFRFLVLNIKIMRIIVGGHS